MKPSLNLGCEIGPLCFIDRRCTCIVDLEGLSMRHLWRPGIKALLRIIEVRVEILRYILCKIIIMLLQMVRIPYSYVSCYFGAKTCTSTNFIICLGINLIYWISGKVINKDKYGMIVIKSDYFSFSICFITSMTYLW